MEEWWFLGGTTAMNRNEASARQTPYGGEGRRCSKAARGVSPPEGGIAFGAG
jgi:hypothetical protein